MSRYTFQIKRQDGSASQPYVEHFCLSLSPSLLLEEALEAINYKGQNVSGENISPIQWNREYPVVWWRDKLISLREVTLREVGSTVRLEPAPGFSIRVDLWTQIEEAHGLNNPELDLEPEDLLSLLEKPPQVWRNDFSEDLAAWDAWWKAPGVALPALWWWSDAINTMNFEERRRYFEKVFPLLPEDWALRWNEVLKNNISQTEYLKRLGSWLASWQAQWQENIRCGKSWMENP